MMKSGIISWKNLYSKTWNLHLENEGDILCSLNLLSYCTEDHQSRSDTARNWLDLPICEFSFHLCVCKGTKVPFQELESSAEEQHSFLCAFWLWVQVTSHPTLLTPCVFKSWVRINRSFLKFAFIRGFVTKARKVTRAHAISSHS